MRNTTLSLGTILALTFAASTAFSADAPQEMWSANGQNFLTKSSAIRYLIALGKPISVIHTRCEILTNKLSFKACPKNAKNNFESAQFKSLTEKE